MYDLAIIGGGAGGLFAGALAAQKGLSVIIIEKNERVGKKLSVTGNGRCNVTNYDTDITKYNNGFPSAALSRYSVPDVIRKFNDLGLITRSEGTRVYPYSLTSSSVLNCLRQANARNTVMTNTVVESILSDKSGFRIVTDRKIINAKRVCLACGSKAGFGSDSSDLLTRIGHTAAPCRPSLCPIPCDSKQIRGLQGVRHKVSAAIEHNGSVMRESGEMLFKANALSGIVSFDLSAFPARNKYNNCIASIDFFPEYSVENLTELYRRGAFANMANKNIIALLDKGDAALSAETAKKYIVNTTANNDFSQAQAVSGGLNVSEFNPYTMQSLIMPAAYAIGEVLDVDGLCGGYNLHWAWISAMSMVDSI